VSSGWADPERGLFSISVAAELAGLHPQTLRIYEREGLVDPARSSGGTRRYSTRDIERLQQITALTAEGLNLAGVRRVIDMLQETRQLQAEIIRLRSLHPDNAFTSQTAESDQRPGRHKRAHGKQQGGGSISTECCDSGLSIDPAG
jgi:MerR family transcriptional regulator/heat shock protein HspR